MDIRPDLWVKAGAAAIAAVWGGLIPLVQLLLVLMLIDIATGILQAAGEKRVSSQMCFKGMTKKAIALLLVAAAAAIETHAGSAVTGMPLDEAVAGFYCAAELISILENAGGAGLPVPQVLKDVLAKLSAETPKPGPQEG